MEFSLSEVGHSEEFLEETELMKTEPEQTLGRLLSKKANFVLEKLKFLSFARNG